MVGIKLGEVHTIMAGCGVRKSLFYKAIYKGGLTDEELKAIPKELRSVLNLRGPAFKGNK